MRTIRSHAFVAFLSLAIFTTNVSCYSNFTAFCEVVRKDYLTRGIYNTTGEDLDQLKCGASYNANTPPALRITANLTYCMKVNSGFEPSRTLSQWATPLFAFLTPTLAFVLVINRPARLPTFRDWTVAEVAKKPASRPDQLLSMAKNSGMFVVGVLVTSILATLDVLLWTVAVFVLAGPIIASALYEALFDHFVLKRIQKQIAIEDKSGSVDRLSICKALVVLLIGSFRQTKGIRGAVEKALEDDANLGQMRKSVPSKLRQLVKLVPTFGDTIIGPALFFLGTFLFSLFDGREKKGDNDLAHGTAFGIWYGVIFIAATACTATLGVARPQAVEPIFPPASGIPARCPRTLSGSSFTDSLYLRTTDGDTYTSEWIWNRHHRFEEWIKSLRKPNEPGKPHCNFYPGNTGSMLLSLSAFFSTVILIGVPCGLAAAISYYTPTVGLGCRSMTVIIYAVSQLFLIIVWFVDVKRTIKTTRAEDGEKSQPSALSSMPILGLFIVGMLLGVFSTVGGTIMQLLGVYRNCVCIAGIRYGASYFGGIVDLASDTREDRDSWTFWWEAGLTALALYSAVLLLTSINEMWMKETCETIIEFLVKEIKTEDAREEGVEMGALTAVRDSGGSEEDDRDIDNDGDVGTSDRLPLLHRYSTFSADNVFPIRS